MATAKFQAATRFKSVIKQYCVEHGLEFQVKSVKAANSWEIVGSRGCLIDVMKIAGHLEADAIHLIT